ncbi:hypothetical protein [Paenibacillus sp. XY044]|uniref:hypothetical protein n=1 Tax=Paenibacillus sp. XY044 TaxID=2026089 RepID=UPI000B9928A6|nr:hypothetical protein [Paenibacillus sp. XY044]OZB91237.1 hypothetical protein CJP46_28470 [Paenibacillus sp. XY044]
MALLRDSSQQDELKEQYDRLWIDFQHMEDRKVQNLLNEVEYKLLSRKEKLFEMLQPFRTHTIWVIPVSVIFVLVTLYTLFIWVALWVE